MGASAEPPGPRGGLLLGSLPELQRDALGFLGGLSRYGDLVRMRFGASRYYFLNHPDYIQRVLVDNHRNYGKDTIGWRNLRLLLGRGLLTSEGDFWLRQRRIAQPAFHRERIAGFGRTMADAAAEMLDRRWAAAGGGPIDVAAEMMRLTLKIVGQTLLSTDVTAEQDEVGRALGVALHQGMARITAPYRYLPLAIPTPENRRYRAARAALDRLIYRMIAERRRDGRRRDDLLSMLLEARDPETGEGMNDGQLRDEAMTIFLAGHETTANALSWTFYLLARHPEAAEKLAAEARGVLGGRRPSLEDLPRLPYARLAVHESLRLYPPAWFTTRSVVSDDELGGFRIRGGSTVMISAYVTHRHPEFWTRPEAFEPERFAGDRLRQLPRFAYFPFGGGPHQCIGNEFAMMEAVLILSAVAARYRLELVEGRPVEPDPLITLRPRHGLLMRLRPA